MKQFLLAIGESRWLRVTLAAVAMASAIDDLLEMWFGIEDLMHLDVAHGVLLTAFTGVLDPLCKLIESNEKKIARATGLKEPE